MSKHLWLYEGVIEYFAGHVQVKEGLTSFDSYLNVLRSKIMEARSYNDTVPFTVMSRGCLGPYKEQYGNVYAKGALIGLCLDVKLRQLSAGRYGVQDLMADLARTYGPQKPFKDEELFDKIASLTYPEVRQFFARYVEGPEPLPLAETFALVGLDLEQQTPVDTLSFGHIYPTVDEQTDTTVVIIGDIELEAGQEKLDYQIGDKIVTIDKQKVTASNFTYFVQQLLASKPVGSTVPMQVLRRDARTNREKLRKVKVKIVRQQYVNTQLLAQPPNPTAAQLELRRAWLGR
jgi:predicted metalloprotease with PDZ domain